MYRRVFSISIILLLILSLKPKYPHNHYLKNEGYKWEDYDPKLFLKLQSIDDIINYTDTASGITNRTSLDYCNFLTSVIRKRFYHGYSHYTMAENFFPALCGTFIWDQLSAVVIPDDLLKYPMAACSQQSIVLMACFKEIGIDYRHIGFAHHYALEGFINGKWYFFDPNMEPEFHNDRQSFAEILQEGRLDSLYKHIPVQRVTYMFKGLQYGKVNETPAPNASLFHYGSYVLFILLLTLSIYLSIRWIYKKAIADKD